MPSVLLAISNISVLQSRAHRDPHPSLRLLALAHALSVALDAAPVGAQFLLQHGGPGIRTGQRRALFLPRRAFVFEHLHVEFGNEAWNNAGPYQCGGFNGPDYWQELIRIGKESPHYRPNVLFHAAGQAANSWLNGGIMPRVANADCFGVDPACPGCVPAEMLACGAVVGGSNEAKQASAVIERYAGCGNGSAASDCWCSLSCSSHRPPSGVGMVLTKLTISLSSTLV